jgi:hypothetical protein
MTSCDHCGGRIGIYETSMLVVVGGRSDPFSEAPVHPPAFSVYHELCFAEHDVPASELALLGPVGDLYPGDFPG